MLYNHFIYLLIYNRAQGIDLVLQNIIIQFTHFKILCTEVLFKK